MQVMPDLASLSLHCRTVALERRLRRRWFAPATRVRVLEPQAGEPPPVHQRPRPVGCSDDHAQHEAGELLAGLTKCPHGGQTRPHQISDRLMCLVENPHRRQCTSPMQLGEIDRISPNGLDPLAWPAGDQRWSDHHTVVLRRRQLSLNAVTAQLSKPAYCETGRPYLRRTSGLARRPGEVVATRDLAFYDVVGRRLALRSVA